MLFKTSIVLVGTLAVASQAAELARAKYESNDSHSLFKRQDRVCKPVTPPVTCERSCGPGFEQCVFPLMCYNPTVGDSCCSNGKYCPKGEYCTDGGCCPDGMSLEECGATRTLSVVPPGQGQSSTEPAPTGEPTGEPTETVSEPEPTETETDTEPTPTGEPTSRTIIPTGTGGPGNPGNNATVTSPSPPQQTDNAASKLQGAAMALGLGAVGLAVAFF
ncbi:predicted protein [Uncinocarpus reesii 1704]|uniref:Proline-rich antigen 3 n=1 Tax=Uncinocarpus reesii (strain UAMH 1704) TaxID=336963 RepID=C4JPP8_UNCRE|nr:uncharacterized protein UREG_03220 [Uncinocarpus reesii 1704]EEP78374.1 predicted protein [Uncinocarpus reesii 1704]